MEPALRRSLVALTILILLTSGDPRLLFGRSGSPSANGTQSIPSGSVDPEYTVQTWIPGQTWNGTTLFGNSAIGEIVEVNMLGQVVWRYRIPYAGGMPSIVTGVMVVPRSNNILYSVLDPPNMRGAYEVNRQGQLVWSYLNMTIAHDAVRLPNGDTLLAATHSEDYGTWPYAYPQVFEVNSQGNVVWQWHAKNDYANNTNYASVRSKDFSPWTHTNEALRLPDGNTMISLRNFNITIIVDSSGKVLQTSGDPCSGLSCKPSLIFDYPDSPYPLPNGDYLIAEGIVGSVVEYNPTQQKIVWQWPSTSTQGTPSGFLLLGDQRLLNGNTLVVDGHGQIMEVNPAGQVVWSLRCACYSNTPGAFISFFRAERTSYMPPGFMIQSPKNGTTYTSGSVPLSLTAGVDLGNVTYSVRNNANNTWIVRNATLLQNNYKNSLTATTVVHGPSSLNLRDGTYTLRIFAGSTGWGYKSFVQQKRINYATQDVVFLVNAATTTVTSSSTSVSSSTSATSTTSSSTMVTRTSSTSSTSSSQSSTTTSSTTTPVPEFPDVGLELLLSVVIVAVILVFVRMRGGIKGLSRDRGVGTDFR